MTDLSTVRALFDYTDWSNRRLLECAAPLQDPQLDAEMHIGPGTLRRTLLHIYNGEHVWLRRWQAEAETPWPSETERVNMGDLSARFEANTRERAAFLDRLASSSSPTSSTSPPPSDLTRLMTYRDSKGGRYQATLGQMLIQGVMHAKHHQAQACNILRRLGAEWPELDYMMSVRRPA